MPCVLHATRQQTKQAGKHPQSACTCLPATKTEGGVRSCPDWRARARLLEEGAEGRLQGVEHLALDGANEGGQAARARGRLHGRRLHAWLYLAHVVLLQRADDARRRSHRLQHSADAAIHHLLIPHSRIFTNGHGVLGRGKDVLCMLILFSRRSAWLRIQADNIQIAGDGIMSEDPPSAMLAGAQLTLKLIYTLYYDHQPITIRSSTVALHAHERRA